MDDVMELGLSEEENQLFNWCRKHTQSITLADICTADGKFIHNRSWEAMRREDRVSSYTWPPSKRPSARAIGVWRSTLRTLYLIRHNDRRLRIPLGPYNCIPSHSWLMDTISDRVFTLDDNGWQQWRRLPSAHSKRYTRIGIISIPPDQCSVASGTSLRNTNLISIDSYSPHITITPPPHIPPTFEEYVHSLPDDLRWQLTKFKVYGSLQTLAMAIFGGFVWAVSDGSLRDTIGTAAYIVEDSRSPEDAYVVGALRTPGIPHFMESQRCELSGLDGIITLIEAIAVFFGLSAGAVQVGCDNVSALRIFDNDYVFNPADPDFDYLSSLQYRLSKSQLQWSPRWIKGHQDTLVPSNSLDRWATLNVQVDAIAKAYRVYLVDHPLEDPAYKGPLHAEGWHFYISSAKWPHAPRHAVYASLHRDELVEYWARKRPVAQANLPLIHWDIIKGFMEDLFPSRRRWYSKFWSSNCGIGTTMLKWKYQIDTDCPRCGVEEDRDHVLLCSETTASAVWAEGMTQLESLLAKRFTRPLIIEVFRSRLHTWRTSTPPAIFPDAPTIIQDAISEQDAIGWQNFVGGWWSTLWAAAQQEYFLWLNRRNTGRRWAIAIILKLTNVSWDMWHHRNGIRHKKDNPRTRKALSLLDQAISEEMALGPRLLPQSVHHYFASPLATILAKPIAYKRSWINAIDTARQMDGIQLYKPERSPLRNWLINDRI
jgi:hypothetical protein